MNYSKLVLILTLISFAHAQENSNLLEQLSAKQLWRTGTPLRLHLGCGTSHLNGYINIDFAPSKHTVQQTSGADIFSDITQLNLPANSVDEIRSHHIFEHFERACALPILCQWHYWLKQDGILLVETPDFEESIKLFLSSSTSYHDKQVIIRHLFGSQEASWAIHYDAWYEEKFGYVLETLGFEVLSVQHTRWQATANIIVCARKKEALSMGELFTRTKELLKLSMVDNSSSELLQWQHWCCVADGTPASRLR